MPYLLVMEPKRGAVIRNRRGVLGLSQADVAAADGPGDVTLRRIERGYPGPYRAQSTAALDRILRWKPGTVQAILDGTADPDPAVWELPETPLTSDKTTSPTDVLRVGEQFLDLLDQHYGTDPESPRVQRAVLGFLRRILNDEAARAR